MQCFTSQILPFFFFTHVFNFWYEKNKPPYCVLSRSLSTIAAMSLTYACNCLNVRLHVASTIDSSSSLTDELGSELMGWKLSLGVGGIVIVSGAAWMGPLLPGSGL
jgi:hypothetical protein